MDLLSRDARGSLLVADDDSPASTSKALSVAINRNEGNSRLSPVHVPPAVSTSEQRMSVPVPAGAQGLRLPPKNDSPVTKVAAASRQTPKEGLIRELYKSLVEYHYLLASTWSTAATSLRV